ncbi:hypothetical protein NP233_g7170 [Leucocoprinus birnbaumii]|uniref:Uncharacterized protein n=1 Tax=Leucocoprinus birnbaumii TaxID=56174 RepID=A0AAD5VS40_9AGAR|nr:hypothetical protein NP233_g7170 [Leucocoprinus birnbaumii]
MQYGRSTTIEKDYLSVFEAMSNLTSLNFSSSTFAWERLDDADLEAFIRVLKLPELKRVTFFCFPGCYLPLSLFAFCGESLVCLEIVDISPEPVNEAHSNPIYDELMNRLLALYQGFRPPSLSLSYLLLRGLGLALNFLEFMERHGLGWSDSNLLTRLDLDLTNTYYPTNLNKPNQAVVAGKILMRFGAALRHLRLHIECDPLNDSPVEMKHWNHSFGAGPRVLRNVEVVELTLTINTTIETDAYVFAECAWSRLSLVLEALPRDNMIRDLFITCEFSLAEFHIGHGGWAPRDRDRCMEAIDMWLWQKLDGLTRKSKYSSIQQWSLTVTFYWGNSIEARRENPGQEITISLQPPKSLPWHHQSSPINASVRWDNELLRELSISFIPI